MQQLFVNSLRGLVTGLLALGACAAQAADTTPAGGTLSIDTPVLSFSGSTPAGANVSGVCFANTVDCDEFALTVDLPSDALEVYDNLKIRVSIAAEFDDETGDYDLYVHDAGGNEIAASATASGTESTEFPAVAGTTDYTVYILPFLVAANSYEGTVELIGLDSGSGGGAGGATGLPADVPLTDVPRAVVAVIDSGVNPYHAFYHAGSPIYSDAAPSAVSLPVLEDFGIGGDCAIELTRTGDFAADYQADLDSGLWEQAAACDMVWFVGTNVIAKSFGPGTRPFLPDDEGDTHGVGTSASVLFANPEAVVVFIEGISDAAETFAMTHPAIDIITTSYGPIGSIPGTGHLNDSFTGSYAFGKLHFGACDNTPSTAIQDSTCGPWWSVGIAGFEETQANEPGDSSNGRQVLSGTFPDFIADFTQTLPYCAECEDGYDDGVGGTSFATPRSAGTASKILLKARRALNYLGGPLQLAAAARAGRIGLGAGLGGLRSGSGCDRHRRADQRCRALGAAGLGCDHTCGRGRCGDEYAGAAGHCRGGSARQGRWFLRIPERFDRHAQAVLGHGGRRQRNLPQRAQSGSVCLLRQHGGTHRRCG